MAKPDDAYMARVMNRRMSRRRAIGTGAKIGGAVVATAIVAGGLGYYAGSSSAPSSSTQTVTNTATQTVTSTVGGGTTTVTTGASSNTGSTTTASSTSSGGGPNYINYPAWVATWPLDFTPDNPIAGLTGTCRVTQFDTITYQSDATIPGTRAYCTQAAVQNTYPNVKWSNFDTGANGSPVLTALEAGQHNWDVTRGNCGWYYAPEGYMEPITDFFNSWEDKAQIPAGTVTAGSYNGDIYFIPDESDFHLGWWRQDLFAAAGYGTFDFNTFEYTGTTPNQMNYQELIQATAKITAMGSSRDVYGTFVSNSTTAILGTWYVDGFLRANGGLRYWGDYQSVTTVMDQAPYYNNNLDSLNFLITNAPNYTPGYPTIDLNALITDITSGLLGFSFGPDPNLDGEMAMTAASASNPAAPAGVNVRDCIMPSTEWADGKPLDPNLPPGFGGPVWCGIYADAITPQAAWEWLRVECGFAAQMALTGNASGVTSRLDVASIIAADTRLDISPWVAVANGTWWIDPPANSTFGTIIANDYANTIDPFLAGTGTPETCISNYVSAVTADLQKAGIPAYKGTIPT
jgi:ABC-type glycerol-3-phosphate transport system substrate-binding protein